MRQPDEYLSPQRPRQQARPLDEAAAEFARAIVEHGHYSQEAADVYRANCHLAGWWQAADRVRREAAEAMKAARGLRPGPHPLSPVVIGGLALLAAVVALAALIVTK